MNDVKERTDNEPVLIHLEAVLPDLLLTRLGGRPGAEALVSILFLPGFNDRLAANLAHLGGTLMTASSIGETGTADQEDLKIITKAIRIYAVLLDDGLNDYIATKLSGQREELPAGISNRCAMFSIAADIFRRQLVFAHKLAGNPWVFGVDPEDANLLLEAVHHLGRVLAAEPKTHGRDELLAYLEETACKYYEKVSMAAAILSWRDGFDGDIENIDALREALEQLAGRLQALRKDHEP